MNKIFYLLILVFAFVSCQKSEREQWEYKTLKLEGRAYADYFSNMFDNPDSKLNALGKEGWELVTAFTETETVHPNFGNAQYVTGLQPNTRTSSVIFVFKRKLIEEEKKGEKEVKAKENHDTGDSDSVIVEEVEVEEVAIEDPVVVK